MSSMLKKSGGLSFKPKIGARRPAVSSSSRPSGSASTTRAPTAESQPESQPSAPPPPAAKQAASDVVNEPPQQTITGATETPVKRVTRSARAVLSAVAPPTPASTQPPSKHTPTTGASLVAKTQGTVTTSPSIPLASTSSKTASTTQPDTRSAPAPKTPRISNTKIPVPSFSSLITASEAASSHAVAPPTTPPSPAPFSSTESITAAPAAVEPQANSTTEAGPSTEPPKKKRVYRKRKAAADSEASGAANGEGSSQPPKKKRAPRKKKPPEIAAAANGGTPPESGAAVSECTTAENGNQEGESATPSLGVANTGTKARRRRETTPEDAENQVLDRTTTKLSDLTRDLHIGKKFRHADVIKERARQARKEAKLRTLRKRGLLPDSVEKPESSTSSSAGTPATGANDDEESGGVAQAGDDVGVGYEVIDGQIVINQASLVIDQRAGVGQNLQTVVEDEFTHLTTSASFMRESRATGPNFWTEEETEQFYYYLKMFGTDFETISHVFPGKSRRHVKLKFNREERLRPNRVNQAIMARGEKSVAIDLEKYKANRRTDDAWITPDKFEAEQVETRRQQEAELEALRKERRELGLLDEDEETTTAEKAKTKEGSKDGEGADASGRRNGNGDGNTAETVVETIEEIAENSSATVNTVTAEA